VAVVKLNHTTQTRRFPGVVGEPKPTALLVRVKGEP